MKSKDILVSIAIIIVAVVLSIFLAHRKVNAPVSVDTAATQEQASGSGTTYTLACADGKSITATFHLPEDATVDVALSDGRSFTLGHAVSADGARYVNADESIVFWNKGVSAFLTEGDAQTYTDCHFDPTLEYAPEN